MFDVLFSEIQKLKCEQVQSEDIYTMVSKSYVRQHLIKKNRTE